MRLFFFAPLLLVCIAAGAQSFYPHRLDDKAAFYLTRGAGGLHGDGVGDDTAAIQAAVDAEEGAHRQGIVFLPEGRYRLSRTLYIWPGIRVIGYGAARPVLVLAPNTPGYGGGLGYMVFFAGGRPGEDPRRRPVHEIFPGTVPATADVIDANPGTFYSAMSNVDFEIGDGNPGAVGIRFHVAQHCFLSHMDFRIGSGLAALKDIGNEAEDLHFHGGRFGIVTGKPSPGWQFTLLDSSFDGEREAAIDEHEAGLTLVGDSFRDAPAAVVIDPHYAEELWIKNSRFENISGPAITISNEGNATTEINTEEILCRHVPVFALLRESGEKIAGPAELYRVRSFSHGLTVEALGAAGEIKTAFAAEPLGSLPPPLPPAIRALPAGEWANLQTLGAVGDGVTDDTAAIQAAIQTASEGHRILYVPSGRYRVTDTIALKADTVLIGLHPSTTEFVLADATPGFDGPGAPKALLSTPPGGSDIVTGIGLYTGGVNSRAAGAMWMAGKDSLMDDVRFLGGHGTNNPDGTRVNPYNNTHTADPDLRKRWDGQYPSLWVLNGGGGTFADIWTPDTYAQAGAYISNTSTEGHVYELSSEHHVRNEMKLDHVANWEIDALQTEEERGESAFALPISVDNSQNILFANYHSYRVVSMVQPYPASVEVAHSENIRFRNLHVFSNSKASFDNSVLDRQTGASEREREVGALDIAGDGSRGAPSAPASSVRKLAGGFFNISGAAVDGAGRLYFADTRWQRIYRWTPETGELDVIRDTPMDATNLFFDQAGDLLIVSYAGDGTVYSVKPEAPESELTLLKPEPARDRPGMRAVLPLDYWSIRDLAPDGELARKPFQYVSPDGTVFLPAGRDFTTGALFYGTKMADVLRAFGLSSAVPGQPFYVSDEGGEKTFAADVGPDGTLSRLRLFAERGGESVAEDRDGNVYIAAGQVFVYSPAGKLLGTIDVPERPSGLAFGGRGGRTLFILARGSLYATEPGFSGN